MSTWSSSVLTQGAPSEAQGEGTKLGGVDMFRQAQLGESVLRKFKFCDQGHTRNRCYMNRTYLTPTFGSRRNIWATSAGLQKSEIYIGKRSFTPPTPFINVLEKYREVDRYAYTSFCRFKVPNGRIVMYITV